MPGKTFVTGTTILTLFSVLFISPASATTEPPPAVPVVIDVAFVSGSGCPPGTTGIAVAPDNTTFTLTYDKYLARLGVGTAPTDFRKNCQLNLSMSIPEGYTYAIARVEHQGTVSLAAGATGMQRTSYYYSGQGSPLPRMHGFTGPLDGDWRTVDEIDVVTQVFPPCGEQRNLNINTELRVMAGTSDPTTTTSSLAMNSSASAVYHFNWRKCPT
jgi:hypothetical protein